MKCNLCGEELNVPNIVCTVCGERQILANQELVQYLIEQYKEYKNKIIQYSKDSWGDNYRTKAIKSTQIGVFDEVLVMLEIALKQYTNVDINNIEIEEHYVSTPRLCDLNSNKICNGCGDC